MRQHPRLIAALLTVLLLAGTSLWKFNAVVIAAQAYVFGYPLVIMDLTRAQSEQTLAPANTLRRVRQFPDASFKTVVRPNVDTLYSTAFLDLRDGPVVFEMPPNPDRYEVMPFMDAWTNVFATLGTRTHGTQGGRFLIAGPGWQGTTPPGMQLLTSPTQMAWLIGRTQTQGPADYPLVHRLQDGLQLQPLKAQTATAPVGISAATEVSPVAQIQRMGTREFFQRLTQLMPANPPSADDAPQVQAMAKIGIVAGQDVAWSWHDTWSAALGRRLAEFKIAQALKKPMNLVNGWSTPPLILGQYGTDYGIRAVVAQVGLGANLPQDAIYPSAQVDSQGEALHGQHRYRLHFASGQWPPVKAFWSITAYGADNFLIDNPAQRFAVGSLSPLVRNADGSLDLLIQAQPVEGPMQANWLPVAAGAPFLLNARLYWPTEPVLNGTWHLPAIERLP
jgi:hypothetical protein